MGSLLETIKGLVQHTVICWFRRIFKSRRLFYIDILL
jgi:hypothetical protein